MSVHLLGANQPADRFYRGGDRIARFRHRPDERRHVPEDWVASTTTIFGEKELGLTQLEDGTLLIDAIRVDPLRWLGAEHVAIWGADTKLLVKLLDAGQRLPVHAHPDTRFARDHLMRPHGKAEAWHILEGGEVFLGLRHQISSTDLASLVKFQRTKELLGLLHHRVVAPGDTVFVPPGVLHAIGEGIFLIEVQEPEDLSVLLEWEGFALDGDRDGHLGLGFDVALDAVDRNAMPDDQLDTLIHRGDTPERLPEVAKAFFDLERRSLHHGDEMDGGFAVVVVIDGRGTLRRGSETLPIAAGDTVVVEHRGDALTIDGDVELVVLRPPTPTIAGIVEPPQSVERAALG